MQKTAQKRSIYNKLREMTNVSGIAAEKFFNPEFQKVMESLRAKDDSIRSIVAGEAIGDGDPGEDEVSLKSLIKSINSNINRREYMSAIADLGRFHKKVFDVVQKITDLNLDVDAVHHEFLFKDLGDEQKKYLQDLKTRFANNHDQAIIKEASIMDFFYNIGTKRGRALAAWEKRYPKQVGKLKKDTATLFSKSESLLNVILSALKEMASARSVRNIDAYVKSADKISKAYVGYDKLFRDFYTANVKGFLEKVELVSPTAKVPEAKEMGQQEVPVDKLPPTKNDPNTTPAGPSPTAFDPVSQQAALPRITAPSEQSISPYSSTLPSPQKLAPPAVPRIQTIPYEGLQQDPKAPDTVQSPPPSMDEPVASETDGQEFKSDQIAKEMWGRSAHVNFIQSLESMSQENPIILASFIKKYATSIQNSDPVTSLSLLRLARNIKG